MKVFFQHSSIQDFENKYLDFAFYFENDIPGKNPSTTTTEEYQSTYDSYTSDGNIEKYVKNSESAFNAGCRRFDGAIKGFGGCPMASDELTGNMPTEKMIEWFNQNNIETGIDTTFFKYALSQSLNVFLN